MALILRIPRPAKRAILIGLGVSVALFVALALWLLAPFWQLSGQFADHATRQPSRLYGRSRLLAEDAPFGADRLVEELSELGYREVSGDGPPASGAYRRGDGAVTVHQRRFLAPSGPAGGELLRISYRGGRIRSLMLGDEPVPSALLEPPLLSSYYGDDLQERRPVRVEELPEHVVAAVLAAEDAGFFRHAGVSPSGILRALWVNLRDGEVRQGGSTLTQQLVKNLYLTPERKVVRKIREAVLAVVLDARYDKREILEAYLNEIYMGASGGVNLIGLGAAARAYFGKEASELDLGEAATLAGMIPEPANLDPRKHAEQARDARDRVLRRMVELEWLGEAAAAKWIAREVQAHPQPVVRRRVPYFADAVAREAALRFGVNGLDDAGYTLLSTLDWRDQRWAEEAIAWGVTALEEGWEKGRNGDGGGPLQAALVSLDPHDGAILAYVGGRDYRTSQFDRAGQARRQAGSAFKPVVYAAAFEDGVAAPSSLVEDAPLTVRLARQRWSPQNDDGDFHGWVTVRTAVEKSYNVATARVALQTGLPRVVELARGLGVTAPLSPVPALALGAFEVSPVEMATVFGTFAAGGERPPPHGLAAVYDARGVAVPGQPLPAPERVLSPQAAYLVTSVLQGVLDRGTARSVRRWGLEDPLAGKTGTSNDSRDSWFAGYSPERVTAVWVGYDDNRATALSGARGALPIWTRFTARMRPPGGFPTFRQPPGIATAVVDPETGALATDACPIAITEVFLDGRMPTEICRLHGRWWSEPLEVPEGWEGHEGEDPRDGYRGDHPFRTWLHRVFGEG